MPPTVRRVWELATVVSFFSAVIWSSKTLTYVMKADSRSIVVREESVRLFVEPREEGSVVFKTYDVLLYGFSPAFLFWKGRQSV